MISDFLDSMKCCQNWWGMKKKLNKEKSLEREEGERR